MIAHFCLPLIARYEPCDGELLLACSVLIHLDAIVGWVDRSAGIYAAGDINFYRDSVLDAYNIVNYYARNQDN